MISYWSPYRSEGRKSSFLNLGCFIVMGHLLTCQNLGGQLSILPTKGPFLRGVFRIIWLYDFWTISDKTRIVSGRPQPELLYNLLTTMWFTRCWDVVASSTLGNFYVGIWNTKIWIFWVYKQDVLCWHSFLFL